MSTWTILPGQIVFTSDNSFGCQITYEFITN